MSEIAADDRPRFHPRALAEVLLKVWAFTMLVRSLANLPMYFLQSWVMRAQGQDARVTTMITTTGVAQLTVAIITGVAILRFAPAIASRLVGENPASDTRPVTPPSWEILAFGLLGTYFLVEGLRAIVQVAFHLFRKPGYEMEAMSYLWREAPEQLAGAIVMTLAGVLLFAGRKGIAALWSRARGI